MDIPEQLSARMALFERKCRERNLRITNQRREIFKTVACSRCHPSAEAVFLSVRQKLANVSLDTVYRTLTALEKMDLLVRVGTPQKERFDGDLRPHAHFICTVCGDIQDVFSPQPLSEKTRGLAYGDVQSVHVQFKGICKRCRQ